MYASPVACSDSPAHNKARARAQFLIRANTLFELIKIINYATVRMYNNEMLAHASGEIWKRREKERAGILHR